MTLCTLKFILSLWSQILQEKEVEIRLYFDVYDGHFAMCLILKTVYVWGIIFKEAMERCCWHAECTLHKYSSHVQGQDVLKALDTQYNC